MPATDGLFLGETDTPRRWDGRKLLHINRITLFGGGSVLQNTWGVLGYANFDGNPTSTMVKVPNGKTFKLWALGQGESTWGESSANIRVYNVTTSSVVRELGLGIVFAEYMIPYTANGACVVRLEGYQNFDLWGLVSGYMLFSIE